jgi:hypothetical protein
MQGVADREDGRIFARIPWPVEGVAVALLALGVAYAVMLFANAWPPNIEQQCAWQFPKLLSCVLGMRENLAGGTVGAAGALFAAWVAWRAIQRQLALQNRQAAIDDITFWQRKFDDATVARHGLDMVADVAERCNTINRQVSASEAGRHVVVAKRLSGAGLLDTTKFPRTGANLIAWKMSDYIARILRLLERTKAAADEGDMAMLDDCDMALREAFDAIDSLRAKVPAEMNAALADLAESGEALVELQQRR